MDASRTFDFDRGDAGDSPERGDTLFVDKAGEDADAGQGGICAEAEGAADSGYLFHSPKSVIVDGDGHADHVHDTRALKSGRLDESGADVAGG